MGQWSNVIICGAISLVSIQAALAAPSKSCRDRSGIHIRSHAPKPYSKCPAGFLPNHGEESANPIRVCELGNGRYDDCLLEAVQSQDWFPKKRSISSMISEIHIICTVDEVGLPVRTRLRFPTQAEAEAGAKPRIEIPCNMPPDVAAGDLERAEELFAGLQLPNDPTQKLEEIARSNNRCSKSWESMNCKSFVTQLGEALSSSALEPLNGYLQACGFDIGVGLSLSSVPKSNENDALAGIELSGEITKANYRSQQSRHWQQLFERTQDCFGGDEGNWAAKISGPDRQKYPTTCERLTSEGCKDQLKSLRAALAKRGVTYSSYNQPTLSEDKVRSKKLVRSKLSLAVGTELSYSDRLYKLMSYCSDATIQNKDWGPAIMMFTSSNSSESDQIVRIGKGDWTFLQPENAYQKHQCGNNLGCHSAVRKLEDLLTDKHSQKNGCYRVTFVPPSEFTGGTPEVYFKDTPESECTALEQK